MPGQRTSSRPLQARGLRRVTILLPAGCAEGLRQLARELRRGHSGQNAIIGLLLDCLSVRRSSGFGGAH